MSRCLLATVALLLCACSPGDSGDDQPADGGGPRDSGVDAGACGVDRDCDDGISCTIDHCEAEACAHAACPDCCPEGFACVVGFGCSGAPEPCDADPECVDDVRCTLDRCRDQDVCEHVPQDDLCADGELCLAALGCIPAPPSDCDSDDDCFGDRACLGTWDCDVEFGCQFVSVTDCGDDDPCTLDACDEEAGGCVHTAQDADGDGIASAACGGADCDDDDAGVHPGAAEACNGVDDDCDEIADEDLTCTAGDVEDCTTACGSTGTRTCLGSCSWDPCVPPAETCNGVDDDCDATCDDGHTCCAGATRDCTLLGFARGAALCLADCSGWDTSTCSRCGDGRRDDGEECDGDDLAEQDCTTLGQGFDGGTLDCTEGCLFDTSGCGAFDPSGLYAVVPTATYFCAFGLVDFAVNTATLTDSGAVLVLQSDLPCDMTGDTATDRDFTVTCVLEGGCDETYTLVGTFTDDDTWQGTLTATFVGDCWDCANQSWDVTGSR